MQAKIYNNLLFYAAGASMVPYALHAYIEWDDLEKREKRMSPLAEDKMDALIDILLQTKMKKSRKYRYDFQLMQKSLDFEVLGNFNFYNRLIALPTYFYFTDQVTNDSIESLKNEYSELKNIDLLKFKELLILTPEEFNYAILYQIHRSLYDYKIVDSVLVSLSALTAINMSYFALKKNSGFAIRAIFSTLFTAVLFTCCYISKPNLFNWIACRKIADLDDLELLDAGINYLNKRIKLEQLLKRDTKSLESQLESIKLAYDSLKERGVNSDPKTIDPQKGKESLQQSYKLKASGILI